MHLSKILSVILVLLFCLPGLSAAGAEEAATVIAVRGAVSALSPDGVVRFLKQQDVVLVSDTIRAGENARLQLLFRDQTLVTLGARGEMKIKDYAWEEKDKKGRLDISVKEGAFRILGGLITQHTPQDFKTETMAATIGIRGSSFAGAVQKNRLKVVFLGGKGIYVTNSAGTVDIVAPMFGTDVVVGQAPPQPLLWTSEQIELLREVDARPVSHSDVETIINQSDNRGATNIAVGKGNNANLGTVDVQASVLKGSVINQADNRGAVNMAVGAGNTANLGSIDVQETTLDGAVINKSDNRGASNVATGVDNEANTGSAVIK